MIASLHDTSDRSLRHELGNSCKWSVVDLLVGFGFFLCQPSRCDLFTLTTATHISPSLEVPSASLISSLHRTVLSQAFTSISGSPMITSPTISIVLQHSTMSVYQPSTYRIESSMISTSASAAESMSTVLLMTPLMSTFSSGIKPLPTGSPAISPPTTMEKSSLPTYTTTTGTGRVESSMISTSASAAESMSTVRVLPMTPLMSKFSSGIKPLPTRISPAISPPTTMEQSSLPTYTTTTGTGRIESSMISTSASAAESMSTVLPMTPLMSTFSSGIKPLPTRSPAISLPTTMEQSCLPTYTTTTGTVAISPTPHQPPFAIPVTSVLLDPFILSMIGTVVLFLVFFAIYLIFYKRHRMSKYRTSFDKVTYHLDFRMAGTQEGNSYVCSPSIPGMSLDGEREGNTAFPNPTVFTPPSHLVTRRATIAVRPNVALTEEQEQAHRRPMSFSGSLRRQRQNQIPSVTFLEGYPNEVVYENPAMLEEGMNQMQQVPGLLVPESVRGRSPSAVFAIPPPPPLEDLELAEQPYPMSPSAPPPEALYEELNIYDPPYSNIDTEIAAVETNVQLGQG